MFWGISLRASRRTISGTRIFPMPWPVKSTLMVSREREPVTGSDQDVDSRPDRAVYAPHAPGPGRVDVHELGSGRAVRAADAPRRHALCAHGR